MLILQRKKDQMIMIGHEVKVVIMEIKGARVKVGFDASRDIPIYRGEIYEEITEKENKFWGEFQSLPNPRNH